MEVDKTGTEWGCNMGVKDDIYHAVGEEGLYMQLAEEAAELSQAASKIARFLHGTNPVANPDELDKRELKVDLLSDVIEEYMDVLNVCEILEVPRHVGVIRVKRDRWIARLNGANV